MRCTTCKNRLDEDAKYCNNCGQDINYTMINKNEYMLKAIIIILIITILSMTFTILKIIEYMKTSEDNISNSQKSQFIEESSQEEQNQKNSQHITNLVSTQRIEQIKDTHISQEEALEICKQKLSNIMDTTYFNIGTDESGLNSIIELNGSTYYCVYIINSDEDIDFRFCIDSITKEVYYSNEDNFDILIPIEEYIEECKKERNNLEYIKEEYLNRIYIISNEEESALEKFNSGLSSKEYGDILYSLYQKYDLVLNEIYNDLEIYLPSEKIKILKDEKIKWISEKEEKLNIEHSDLEDNLSYIEVNEMLCSLTKERCYELIECIE
ncbi:Uncharacterized protein conserved in bacteria [uncultured Clostridium sp.]|nr:Uncharacterized protein conserved in bacteria [uncultured Clostridium sp.]